MDNFKAYNDAYGFSNGDRIIRALADSMREIGEKEAFPALGAEYPPQRNPV